VKKDHDSIDEILSEAKALRQTRQPGWPDYEFFKKRIAAIVAYGPAYDLAIDLLLEGLDL
jgi:hypothetical protein